MDESPAVGMRANRVPVARALLVAAALTGLFAMHGIEMARTEISDGRSPDAITMAKDIATAQAAEIEKMRALLDD